ncbi:hypothetical protein TWF788_006461 [Orbilia oligospora]|uniref:HMG box domain-containing protein n=1 Tax=Orbilia oligospora TaxID=2813651 RepID=A0A7C8P5E5_ORBOL|nr:hypothetical protein TWF788_006461 [Orbilia oligospora]
MLAVGRSRLAASSGLSLPKLSALVARAIARSGPLSSGAANAINSQATFAPFVKANLPLLTSLVLREYATATKKTTTTTTTKKTTATKKKAPAKKSTTKKPAAKRRTVAKKSGTRRTATKKKLVAKKKKKAAPKKKKVVRKKKAVVKKPGIQVQYDKALGDAPPRKTTSYSLFFIDALPTVDSSLKASERAKKVAEKWRGLPEAEKKAWSERAAEESIKKKAAYAQWLAKQNPLDIEAANHARNRIRGYREKRGIKGSNPTSRIKDDRLVKRPRTAWVYFMQEKYHSGLVEDVGPKLKMAKLAEVWKATSPAEKKKYQDLCEKDIIRYKAERAEFLKKYQH